MKFNADQWKAAYKKAASDLSSQGSSDGIVCVLATLRYIQNGICDDIGGGKPEQDETCQAIRECIAELWADCKSAKLAGFASNASSAAAACGLKVEKAKAVVDVSV